MGHFIRLIQEPDRGGALRAIAKCIREGGEDPRHYTVMPDSFEKES